jgi:hypothetical protein
VREENSVLTKTILKRLPQVVDTLRGQGKPPPRHLKMKLNTAVTMVVLATVLVNLHPGTSSAQENSSARERQTVTAFSYHAGPDDSRQTARALALYGAKYKAVLLSADRLAGRGLLKDYGNRRMEIFCLVADEMQSGIIHESFSEKNSIATVKIESSVSLNDFVRAEIRNTAFEKEEMHFSLQEEMEPVVSPTIAPARELSRAYRYIRKHHWRMAIIYLDHLEKKYPHWGTLFLAKAMAYLGMHETDRATSALSSACYLGDQEACLKINELDPSD